MVEEKILGLIEQKNAKGLQLLFDLYFDNLFNYAFKLTSNKEDSEDVVQTVFLDLWEKGNLRKIRDLKPYLYQMAKFQVYKVWSKRENISDLLEDYNEILAEENAHLFYEHSELNSEINQIIDSLPQGCRQVFELSRNEGLSLDEIASKLNLSKQTVKNQLSKSLGILRKELNKKELLSPGFILNLLFLYCYQY